MTLDEVKKLILSFDMVSLSQPFTDDLLVFAIGNNTEAMFAIVNKDRTPLRLSLRCDPQLAVLLRDKYEEVLPGDHLDNRKWNTIILSGQLQSDDIKDLIRHSYLLTREEQSDTEAAN